MDKPPVTQFLRDQSNLTVFCSAVWQALGMAVGEKEAEELVRLWQRSDKEYEHYVTHYVDKCNLELIKTPMEKRARKLINITRRLIKKPDGYFGMEYDLKYWAKEEKVSIYELQLPELAYPGEIQW